MRNEQTKDELLTWLRDGVNYAPNSPPGQGPWAYCTTADGYRVDACPDCQRRMIARGLRIPGRGWKFEWDTINVLCPICGHQPAKETP